MPDRSRRFRTTEGYATVRGDAIGIASPPREFLAGQRARWRAGTPGERMAAMARIGTFLLAPILGGYALLATIDSLGNGMSAAGADTIVNGITALTIGAMYWSRHVRETEIPLSAVTRIVIDEDAGEMTITYDGSFPSWGSDPERTLGVRTAEDLRKAREILHRRGVSFDRASQAGYRFSVEGGTAFCEHCHARVSPGDRECPACGHALSGSEQPAPAA